jgi:Fe2+/Zn2+ uptake regulation proteins
MSTEGGFPSAQHDHSVCRSEALQRAVHLCDGRSARLTDIRRRVLEDVWRDHRPVSAYDILARLNSEESAHGHKLLAPPTIYRALEFLIAQGLVHRLATLNAYIGCASPEHPHGAQFLICRVCGSVAEIADMKIAGQLNSVAKSAGFVLCSQVIELDGLCPRCQSAAPDS